MFVKGMIGPAALAATLALAGCATTGADGATARDRSNPITAAPHIGRCHMGGCSWFDIRSFEMVRETESAALLRLDMRDGSSSHPGGRDTPTSSRGVRIDWSPYDRNTYVFCSTQWPAIISPAEGGTGWDAYRIDLLMSAGATEYVTQQYLTVCHPDGALNAEGAAERAGYRRVGDDEPRQLRLGAPEEMFDRAVR